MLILNDIHLGVQRSAGTTPASALQLRQWLQASFRNFIRNMNEPLIINGDLFDSFSADNVDVLDCFHTLSTCAERNALYLVAGNHDLAKDSNKLSSFEWLASVLRTIHPNSVFTIMAPTWLRSRGIYVIPHLVNQQALMISYVDDFKLMMIVTLLAIPLALILRKPRAAAPAGAPAAAHMD